MRNLECGIQLFLYIPHLRRQFGSGLLTLPHTIFIMPEPTPFCLS